MDGFGEGRFADFVAATDDMDGGGELDRGITMDPVVLEINFEESHGGRSDSGEEFPERQ